MVALLRDLTGDAPDRHNAIDDKRDDHDQQNEHDVVKRHEMPPSIALLVLA
jgi:hypothetical protein